MNPPAKLSPAPVGSCTSSSGNAGTVKMPLVVHHHGAVLAALDDQRCGAQLENVPRRAQQIVLVREHARLRVVDHQDVACARSVSRSSAGVSRSSNSWCRAPPLRGLPLICVQHRGCSVGSIFARKTCLDERNALRQLRLEVGEDIQLRRQRDALVRIGAVTPGPEKRLSRGALQAGDIDAAALEDRVVAFR